MHRRRVAHVLRKVLDVHRRDDLFVCATRAPHVVQHRHHTLLVQGCRREFEAQRVAQVVVLALAASHALAHLSQQRLGASEHAHNPVDLGVHVAQLLQPKHPNQSASQQQQQGQLSNSKSTRGSSEIL